MSEWVVCEPVDARYEHEKARPEITNIDDMTQRSEDGNALEIISEPIISISVVIPTFNRAETICRCIDSILSQTVSPFEILVVDDCSTDETKDILQRCTDARIRYIMLDKNSGAQAARNRGIREATGNWIAFQDSDDEWLPDKIERQLKALAETGFDPWTVVHSSAIWLDTATGKKLPVELPIIQGDNVYPQLLTKPAPMFPAMLVSCVALEKINWLDEKVPSYQEWDTAIRLAKHCRFIYLKEPLFVYNLHEGETISKNRLREITGYQYVIDKFRDEIIKVCGEQTWKNHIDIQLIKCLNFRLWSEADKYLARIGSKSFKYDIFKLFRLFHLPPGPVLRLLSFVRGKGERRA